MKHKLLPRATKTSFLVLRIVALFYFCAVIVVIFFMDSILFLGQPLPQDYKFPFTRAFEERMLDVAEQKVHSLYFRDPAPRGLILYFHGNAGSLKDWGYVAEEFSVALKMDVWIVDYPGYGKSEGTIRSEEQLFQIAEHMWIEAVKHFPPEKIMIYGRSLGSGIATHLASEHKNTHLVLESPYFSIASMVKNKIPFFPSHFVPYPMRSDLKIANATTKNIIIFHGSDDEVIPFAQGEQLAALVPEATFIKIPGGQHNNLSESGVILRELNARVGRWTEPAN